MSKTHWSFILSGVAILLLFFAELFLGSVHIGIPDVMASLFGQHLNPIHDIIVLESRIPRAFTAMFAGGGLALCGMLMQRFFHNPLAGPSVLGITSGASFGVALVVLLTGGAVSSNFGISLAAFSGAMGVLLLILLASTRIKSAVTLLILGLMVGYVVSAGVTILQAGANKDALRSFVFWGMGTFSDLQTQEVFFLGSAFFLSTLLIAFSTRKLDLFSLGNEYALSMGLNVKRFRFFLLIITGILTGIITAYCGPIAFIGLAVPHLARGIWQSGKHKTMVPAVVLTGMIIGLVCDLLLRIPLGMNGLPLNAITSLIGAPVVIYILVKGRKVF